MNLDEVHQTSGFDWSKRDTGERVYYAQLPARTPDHTIQLSELAEIDAQMARYDDEYRQLIERIRVLYVFQDEETIAGFLRSHRRIPILLINAEPQLRRVLGHVVLSLRATTDEHGWQMLYVSALWPGEPEEALRALDSFDEKWWLAHSYPVGSSLTFTYRLV